VNKSPLNPGRAAQSTQAENASRPTEARPGRITITQRHTGRFYLGAGPIQFAAIYSMLLTAEAAQSLGIRLPKEGPAVLAAFKKFVDEIKVKAGTAPIQSAEPAKSVVRKS
jgi:hypothetical protein